MDFPNSPSVGDIYTFGLKSWRWNGAAWDVEHPLTAWASISGTPTTVSGYGITDAVMTAGDQVIGGNKTFSNNVTMNGSIFSVNTVNLEIADPIITVAKNNTGTTLFGGLKVERGSAGNDAYAIWLEEYDCWYFGTAADDNLSGSSRTPIYASQLNANVPTGTAPLVVASTTLVSNLNTDLLDGQHGSFYQDAANITGTISDARLPTTMVDKTLSGTATLSQQVRFSGVTSVGAFTADQHNYSLGSTISTLRLSGTAERSITGIAGGATGRIILVRNTGTFDLIFVHESASSTAANRFSTPGGLNVTLGPGATLMFQYDGTLSRWQPVGGAGGSGGTNASLLTSGTLLDARLSANVALTNALTVFTSQVEAPTLGLGDSSANVATTAFVANAVANTSSEPGFDGAPWDSALHDGFSPIYATGTGTSQNITLPVSDHVESSIWVTVGNVLQPPANYAVSGTTLTITAPLGSDIVVRSGGFKGDPGAAGTMSASGDVLFASDDTYKIGNVSASRPKYVYVSNAVYTPFVHSTNTIHAATITTSGATNRIEIGPRDGSGSTYYWYNPTGDDLKLYSTSASSNVVTIANNGTMTVSNGEFYQSGSTSQVRIGVGSSDHWDLSRDNVSTDDFIMKSIIGGSPTEVIRLKNSKEVVFSGLISANASSTAEASLNIAPGVAPSSPNNGDVWTTSDGLYVRIAGSTHAMEKQGEAWDINTQTGSSYTLVLSDKGKIIETNNASANTLTIPPNSSVAFPLRTRIDIVQYGAGQTTFVAGGGVTIRSVDDKLALSSQYSSASLYKRGTDEWVLMGDLSDNAAPPIAPPITLRIQDVFATNLYTGSASAQTITNGIDLLGQGGLVWAKCRDQESNHFLIDTARGDNVVLSSNLTNAQGTGYASYFDFNNNGFGLPTGNSGFGPTGASMAAWTFRKAARFFDVVTYNGSGTIQVINHNLGTTPGMIIIKRLDNIGYWTVYHRNGPAGTGGVLNTSDAFSSSYAHVTAVSSTNFTLASNANVNNGVGAYVAYLFAHDTDEDGLVQCGSFTTDASGNATVNLGWEPQFALIKRADGTSSWKMLDTARGWAGGIDPGLYASASIAEEAGYDYGAPASTGFTSINNVGSATYVYLAIRKGPM